MSRSRRKKVAAPKKHTAPALAVSREILWHEPVDRLLLSLSSWQLPILAFVVGCAVVISRRPDAILNPQFWAEDGGIFYGDAYAGGFRSLVLPDVGYLVSLQRLVALAVQPLPLLWAPAVFNIVGIAIQVLPAVLLVSRRFMSLNLSGRALLALLYLALPNSSEVHVNLTNAQWHLALLACLVMVAEPSRGVGWRIFDRIALVLAGLTGPFCLVLAPIAVVVWSRRRDQRRLITAAILSFCAVMQTIVLLFNAGTRSRAELGASPALLIKILSRHVFLGPIEGMRHPLAGFMDQSLLLSAAVVVLGFSVVLVAFWIGPLELRAFLVFGLAIYASALARPQASDTAPQWEVLFHSDSNRYSLLPMLVFIAALVRLLGARVLPLKWAAAATLLACSVGIARDWRIQPYQDLHFPTHARAFSQAPPGTTVTIPTNPPGWKMQLVKH